MNITAEKIIVMFSIMIIGYICGKIGLIPEIAAKKMSDVLLLLVSPCLTFMSYQREYSPKVAMNLLLAFGLAVVIHFIMMLLSLVVIKGEKEQRKIEIISSVLSNCGFMGIPIIQSIYGGDGVIFLTMYVAVFHIIAWSFGVAVMTGEKSVAKTLKHLVTPTVISVLLGLLFFFCRINLPELVKTPLNMISDMNTPLAMLVAGATLSATKLKSLIKKPRILLVSLIRLVVSPVICAFLGLALSKMGADTIPVTSVVVAAACPTAVITVSFAYRYNGDAVYASEIFAATTLLSAFTIPLATMLTGYLGI